MPSSQTLETFDLAERYLRLMRLALTRSLPGSNYAEILPNSKTVSKALRHAAYSAVQRALRPFRLSIVQTNRSSGETMMGMGALDNLHSAMHQVIASQVPGDFVETGVWRGGGTIYMRAFLEAHQIPGRQVWVCDSFEGLPNPKDEYQTMPSAPIDQIAVLRLDGDMYESTIVVLEHLYPKVSPGGIVIIDDHGMLPECNRAVEDYRSKYAISEPLRIIGYVSDNPLGAYWCKD